MKEAKLRQSALVITSCRERILSDTYDKLSCHPTRRLVLQDMLEYKYLCGRVEARSGHELVAWQGAVIAARPRD